MNLHICVCVFVRMSLHVFKRAGEMWTGGRFGVRSFCYCSVDGSCQYWGFLCLLWGVLPYARPRRDIWPSEKEISHVRTPIPGLFAFMEHLQKRAAPAFSITVVASRTCTTFTVLFHGRVFVVCASVGKVSTVMLRVVINTSPDWGGTFPAGWKRSFNNLFPLHVGLSGGKTDLNNYQATVRAQRPENGPKLQCLNCPNVCCATSRKEHVMRDINN